MGKQYRIRIEGTQREEIDADLMAQLVVMLGRELAEDAWQAAMAAREAERAEDEHRDEPDDDRSDQP